MGDYQELANILNLAMVCKDDDDRYFVVASWLDSHDQLIKELLSSPDVFITPRKRYSTTGRNGSVHFTADDGGRVFVCITKENYPARVGCSQHRPNHQANGRRLRPLWRQCSRPSRSHYLFRPGAPRPPSLSPPGQVAHMCLEEMQDHILLSPHNSASPLQSEEWTPHAGRNFRAEEGVQGLPCGNFRCLPRAQVPDRRSPPHRAALDVFH
jgi:hypothetical protein